MQCVKVLSSADSHLTTYAAIPAHYWRFSPTVLRVQNDKLGMVATNHLVTAVRCSAWRLLCAEGTAQAPPRQTSHHALNHHARNRCVVLSLLFPRVHVIADDQTADSPPPFPPLPPSSHPLPPSPTGPIITPSFRTNPRSALTTPAA